MMFPYQSIRQKWIYYTAKQLRMVKRDRQRIYPREILDTIGKAKPGKFVLYSTASILINSYTSGKPKRLSEMLKENEYRIKRTDSIGFFDASKKKIGFQAISNRLVNSWMTTGKDIFLIKMNFRGLPDFFQSVI